MPVRAEEDAATGFELLQAVLQKEAQYPPPEDAPSFILLPEYSIRPDEIEPACRSLRELHSNTIAVFGVGQMTQADALSHDPQEDLWYGSGTDRLTNCAIIALGGSGRAYVQPKIIPSRWEENLLLGQTVRYFVGSYVQLVVVICSDLLARPENSTVARSIVDQLQEHGWSLNLVVWIQHNPRPRSQEFVDSFATFTRLRPEPTIIAVGSRKDRSRRLDNFAVSGALLPQGALPSRFNLLSKPFHYIEPLSHANVPMSRAVLLRYDADCNLVKTVLADSISPEHGAARGALFESSIPFLLGQAGLIESTLNTHLEDICRKATSHAQAACPHLGDQIQSVGNRITALHTREFLAFLDLAILPRPRPEDKPHIAGQKHENGDFLCTCWAHRECIDKIADEDEFAGPFCQVLIAWAALEKKGVIARPIYDDTTHLTFLFVDIAQTPRRLAIVYPFNLDGEGTQRSLFGSDRPPILDRAYVILGTGDRPRRPVIPLPDAARSIPSGALGAGTAAAPQLRAIYNDEFWSCFTNGTLQDRIVSLFG